MPARDPADLYKDKVEVSLDGRQIFYLFFGGAVVVGLVFVLGVMVGRRVEARGHVDPVRTAAAADPLAALDRLEGSGAGLSFKGALTGTPAPTEVERAIGEVERARKAAQPAAASAGAASAHGAAPAAVAPMGAAPAVVAKAEPKAEKAEKAEKKPEPKGEKSERAEKSEKSEKAEKSEKSEKSEKAERPARSSEKKVAAREDGERKRKKPDGEGGEPVSESRGRFTLQLSSFQDKHEAEAFLEQLKGAGFQPYVTEASVGGKGTFYRVRLGSYRSLEAATDAKAEVERVSRKTASVMRL
jgi:cell division protein FtsN